MATYIAVYDKNGKCIGRCDSHCSEARDPHCVCVCGGRNHGGGKKKAIENTRQLAESWIAAYAALHGPIERTELGQDVLQMSLWEQ
jgi:hypothetical protein